MVASAFNIKDSAMLKHAISHITCLFTFQSAFETSNRFRELSEEMSERIKSVLADRTKDFIHGWRFIAKQVNVRPELFFKSLVVPSDKYIQFYR